MAGGYRSRLAGAIVAITLLAPFALASSAGACSCAQLTPKSVDRADAAAVMRLDSVETTDDGTDGEISGPGRADYTYEVRDVLAGRGRLETGQIVTIESPTDGAACGLESRKGRKYGLLLDRRKGSEWTSSLCSTTSLKHLRRLAAARAGGDDRGAGKPAGCR